MTENSTDDKPEDTASDDKEPRVIITTAAGRHPKRFQAPGVQKEG